MLKHHKLISFVIGLGFLVIFQKFASPQPIFRFLVPALLLFTILVTLYNRWYLLQIQKYNIWILLRPILLIMAAFGIASLVPSAGFRGIFLIACVAVITFVEILLETTAENILLNETLIIAFGLFFTFSGYYYNAPAFESLYLMGIFLSSALLTRSFYEPVPRSEKDKLVSSLAIGLFCSELFWSLNFLHFHFSVLALILFNIFYFCLILNYYYFFHTLNFKKIQFHFLLISVCDAMVLLSTPWHIIR